ncbi:DUF1015 domain-containing protein [bacterium]|nr:DUF1015 domain-containing protein [bacterium]
MADIKPFKGITYNNEIIKNMSLVIAPPYDVISPEEQDQLYGQSLYNIIRLIKGKELPGDNPENDPCTRANNYFQEWLRDKILVQDKDECFYALQDEYRLEDGTKKVRKGFFALFRLEEFGAGCIYPHERTLAGPKEDRFRLMKACSANFSSIFSLYSDPDRIIDRYMEEDVWSSPPDMELLSQQRVLHRLWRVSDPLLCSKMTDAMAEQKIFIADGHHRYETALNYQKFMRERFGIKKDLHPYDYCMMYFTNTQEKGLSILPYHRVVKNLSQHLLDLLEYELQKWFDVRAINFDGISVTEATARKDLIRLMAKNGDNRPSFGLYMGKRVYYLLVLKTEADIEKLVPGKGSMALKSLDVNILHSLILDKILGISAKDFEHRGTLMFVHDLRDALGLVNMKTCQAAFILNPTRMDQVMNIALRGEKMPQKSTFFYPKLPSGLVIRKIA